MKEECAISLNVVCYEVLLQDHMEQLHIVIL